MKTDFAPKYVQHLDQSYLLWFQPTNTYTIVSEELKHMLDVYLKSDNQAECITALSKLSKLPKEAIDTLFHDISNFLERSNTVTIDNSITHQIGAPSKHSITRLYRIREYVIKINFGSQVIEGLIHPQLSHLLIEDHVQHDVVFDIFQTEDQLFLYKDSDFIGAFETAEFHLLQGKFALEFMNVMYDKTEADWLATFHASTVSNNKEAIMIVGNSGNGKSTLSALLLAHGFDVLADDVTPILADDMQIYRNPSGISVKEGAFPLLASIIPEFNSLETYISGSKNKAVKYLSNDSGRASLKAQLPCTKMVYVTYSRDAKSELTEVPAEKILETLIPESWISPNPKHAKRFLNWLTGITFHELTYSENDFAVTTFKTLFNS